MQINLEHAWREDWPQFLSADQKKQHWIAQRLLEDENQWLEERPQPTPRAYIQEKKVKLSPVEIIKRGYAVIAP